MRFLVYYLSVFIVLCVTNSSEQLKLGIVHHFGNPAVTKGIAEVKEDVDTMQSLGFDFVREGIYWDSIKSDDYVKQLKARLDVYRVKNIDILGLLAYSSSLVAKNKFSFVELSKKLSNVPIANKQEYIIYHFSKYFEWTIENFPNIKHYEVLNEVNLPKYFQGGKDPISVYISILKACYPIAQKYNVKLLTGGLLLEGDFMLWLDQLIKNRRYYDALSLHPYCYPKRLSEAKFKNFSLAEIVDKINKSPKSDGESNIEIWITEVGWLHSSEKAINKRLDVLNEDDFKEVLSDTLEIQKRLGIEKTFIYSFEDDSYSSDPLYKPFGFQLKSGILK